MDNSNGNRRSLAPKLTDSPLFTRREMRSFFYAIDQDGISEKRREGLYDEVCRLMADDTEDIIVYIPPLPKGDSQTKGKTGDEKKEHLSGNKFGAPV
jgi:hypothetical protein